MNKEKPTNKFKRKQHKIKNKIKKINGKTDFSSFLFLSSFNLLFLLSFFAWIETKIKYIEKKILLTNKTGNILASHNCTQVQ